MKQRIALLFTALFVYGFTQAQVSRESFEKAVDYLNCKTVELSLKEDKNYLKFQRKCICGTTTYTQINQFLNSVNLDATVSLSREIEDLKKSFQENWQKDDIVTLLSESVFNDKNRYRKISTFAEKRKGKPEFDTYKLNLKTDLANKITESIPSVNVSQINTKIQQSTLEERISELENILNMKKNEGIFGSWTDYLILISFLISCITIFFGLKNQFGNNNEVSNEIQYFVQNEIEEKYRNIVEQYGNSRSKVDNKIRSLEEQIVKIDSKFTNSNLVSNSTTQTSQTTILEVNQPEVTSQIFFLSTPNSDGSFNESSSSSIYKDGATIYRFIKIGINKAKFQIDEKDASARLALQYPDKNIDPVCDAVNAFNPKATRITTVEQGIAELQNGRWVVDRNNKTKIKYES